MRLGVDGWRLHGPLTGVGRYVSNVLAHWHAGALADRFERATVYTPVPLDRARLRLPDALEERVLRPRLPMLAWDNVRLGPSVRDDVLFCPSYARPLATRSRCVVTIFEATAKLHPEYYPRRVGLFDTRLYGWSGRHSVFVITATEAARRDIVRAYGFADERIRVVPLAPAEIFAPRDGDPAVEAVRRRYVGSEAPYFLHVGKLTARRNAPLLIEAFAEVERRTGGRQRLVVVGLNTSGVDLPALAQRLGVGGHLVYVEHVPDEDLGCLYSGAEAFVMPYAYEALSLTALEAQASGTPVITVDTPGLREQTGGHALLVPRATVPEIAGAMERVAGDGMLRARLRDEGLVHAGGFTWGRCSHATLDVLAEAARL